MTRSLKTAALLLLLASPAAAQGVRVRELTSAGGVVPVRLVGYGLVVGLEGTGDRALSGQGQTVRSVANLLRNFDIVVPPEMLRTRNVAAVLVTGEASPYLRPGGRLDVQVASAGDATSLRGGVLWMTPLVAEAGGTALAVAQGPVLVSEGAGGRSGASVETAARIPGGAVLEAELPRPALASDSRLLLRQPELGTAVRIAQAVNDRFGAGTAVVEDPGAVSLRAPDGTGAAEFLAAVGELRVTPDRRPQVVVDGRDGTLVAGGGLVVRESVVSHGAFTLTVGGPAGDPASAGDGAVRVAGGASVQEVAASLHAVGAPPGMIAAIFEALQQVGALDAEVVLR